MREHIQPPAWRATGQAIFAVIVLALPACGGGDIASGHTQNSAATNAPTASGPETGADHELVGGEIGGSDEYGFAFAGDTAASPGPTLVVTAGAQVTVRFENISDEQKHNFVVAKDPYGTFLRVRASVGRGDLDPDPGPVGRDLVHARRRGDLRVRVHDHGPRRQRHAR